MRRPVQSFYGGAHLFRAGVVRKMSKLAVEAADGHGLAEIVSDAVAERVREKLVREPLEDLRIDFEDGYGTRPDDEEDSHAQAAGQALAAASELPPFVGVRIKSDPRRGYRTLDLFLDSCGAPPPNFLVTLPKVTSAVEIENFTNRYDLRFEIMVETPEAIRDLRGIVSAAKGRCVAAHFGPYDFTAACGVPGPAQRLGHPLCDWARHSMAVALAGTGVRISDGPTTIMPVGNRESVQAAWRLHIANIEHAIECGIYQGWDLHPAQLPARYAALYRYFTEHAPAQRDRLANFRARQEQATRVGQAFDDAATVRGLIEFFEQGRNCGALRPEEIPDGI